MPQFGKGNTAAKKGGRLSLKWRQHLERELRKKEKEEKEADDEEAAAVAAASAAVGAVHHVNGIVTCHSNKKTKSRRSTYRKLTRTHTFQPLRAQRARSPHRSPHTCKLSPHQACTRNIPQESSKFFIHYLKYTSTSTSKN